MNSFNDILASMGTKQSPLQKPSGVTDGISKPLANPATGTDALKLPARPALTGPSDLQNGNKRKAESELRKAPGKTSRPNTPLEKTTAVKPTSGLTPEQEALQGPAVLPKLSQHAATGVPTGPKPGSYAWKLEQARLNQEKRGQNQVGVIKHLAASKEPKPSVRRRQEEDRSSSRRRKPGERPGDSSRIQKRRSISPAKRAEGSKKMKASAPPLSAPTSAPTYKGTLGMRPERAPPAGSSRDRFSKRSGKLDEYLATDEEDEGGDGEDDSDDGYGTDASSNMEAGAFDIDREENAATKFGREEDAKEAALENQKKREKEERRKKLQKLADKRR